MIQSSYSLSFNGKSLLNNSKEMLWQRNIYQVTTSTDGRGTMTASPMSGIAGTNVTLSNTPNADYYFSGYSITGATLTGNKFNLIDSDVTVQANFRTTPYVDYYSNDTRFCLDQYSTLPLNIDITQTNYAVAKYDVEFYTNPGDSVFYLQGIELNLYSNVARTPTTASSMTAKTNDFTANYGTFVNFTDSGTNRFIIDRSANRISAFYGDQPLFYGTINYSYLSGSMYTTATAYADSINKITEMEWGILGSGQQCISNIKIGGTTSISDALNY